jgi:hypothetical protein
MGILNKRYNYGVEFYLLSVDEGITGYRDDSLEVYHSKTFLTIDGQTEYDSVQLTPKNCELQGIIWMDYG